MFQQSGHKDIGSSPHHTEIWSMDSKRLQNTLGQTSTTTSNGERYTTTTGDIPHRNKTNW